VDVSFNGDIHDGLTRFGSVRQKDRCVSIFDIPRSTAGVKLALTHWVSLCPMIGNRREAFAKVSADSITAKS
jgi:hypothetical protein